LENANVAVAPATAVAGGTATLTATLTDADTHAPLAGRTLVFSLNGHVVGTATTNSNGTASLPGVSVAGLLTGYFPGAVTMHFAGDAADLPGDRSGAINVLPARDVTDQVRVHHEREDEDGHGRRGDRSEVELEVTNRKGKRGETLTGLFALQL